MLGLHRLDSPKQPTDPPLPPPGDFFEVEERRRTWWVIFCSDRFVSGITGWPALVNEKDVSRSLEWRSLRNQRADVSTAYRSKPDYLPLTMHSIWALMKRHPFS